MNLTKLRSKIDQVDKKIIQLLNLRSSLALDISKVKKATGTGTYSPGREREVLKNIIKANQGPLKDNALEAIYREVMSASLSLAECLGVAYLGPQATFTHLAALKRFGSQVKYIPAGSINEVFLEVDRGSADYGVVPIENSVEGAVTHTLDVFMESDLKICAQIILDVSHNLLANCPKDKIRAVYSNPQVFGQCRSWLERNLPLAEQVEVPSTTRAAEIAAKKKFSACIASSLAAKVYKLKLKASDIEDSPHNITRFLVVGRTEAACTGNDRTSILFSIKDKVGALYEMLVPFKKNKINLTKIESRPSKKRAWDYYFFVDLSGHQNEPRVKRALLELENKCKFLKVLGSYPVGE